MNSPASPSPLVPAGLRPGDWRRGLSYGLLGLPLAFVALPLHVLLPHHYATSYGVPLAQLGALLLAARLLDAVVDPWLGRWSDRLFARSPRHVLVACGVAAALLALGLAALFFPLVRGVQALTAWVFAVLTVTYAAYSLMGIAHQSWGARLGGEEPARARVVAWREGAGLVGVLLASVLPTLAGFPAMVGVFAAALAAGWLAWAAGPRPGAVGARPSAFTGSLWSPWRHRSFRRLLLVFVLNGIATAVPATLVLFFIADRLQSPATDQPLFLATYFLCAAVGIPIWLKVVHRLGLARTWLLGMCLSVLVFGWAASLGAGDRLAFGAICALSGLALGTDLALPSALLAGVIARSDDTREPHHGAYFGWWNLATKLNLALAAGLALPLLSLWGYQPGGDSPKGLQALTWAYAVLPCMLKLLAATALFRLVIRPSPLEVSP